MTDKQIIIDDQKKTIHRLQDECTEKTNAIIALGEQLKAKEQECEELKEAQKNSRCAWKSLEGTFCPQAQEQLEAYKMEAEEGKEINAELKAENDELKKCYKNNSALLDFEETNTTKLVNKVMKLEKTLTEIKEIAEKQCVCGVDCIDIKQILQKISECEVVDE